MRSHVGMAMCRLAATVVLALPALAGAGDRQADYIQLRLLIGEQRFSEALERCRLLIATYPDYVYLYETLPEIALYAQDLEGAAQFFEERIDDGTCLELSYFGLGTVYYDMAAYREAALCFDRAIELGIAAPECYRNFVYAFERLEGVDASIRFFNSLCHRDPKNPHFWYAAALAYWSKKDYSTVLKNLEEALSLNPNETKYLQAKGAVLVLLGQRVAAARIISDLLLQQMSKEDYNTEQFLRSYLVLACELDGDSSNAKVWTWRNLEQAKKFGLFRWVGWGYERIADYEFLSSNFQMSLSFSHLAIDASRLSSDQTLVAAAWVRQYESHMEIGNYSDALESVHGRLSHFSSSTPITDSIRALIDFAWAYHEMGEEGTAMAYAIEALNKIESEKSDAAMMLRVQSTMGLIYEGLGNYNAALRSYQSSLDLVAHDKVGLQNLAIVHGNIGRVCLALGHLNSSISHLRAELSITRGAGFQKEEAYAHSHLGQYFLKRMDLERSRQEFDIALRLGRRLGQRQVLLASMRGLALVAEAGGDFQQALDSYRKAIQMCDGMVAFARHPWGTSNLERERQNDYRECVKLLCLLHRYDEAYVASEAAKMIGISFPCGASRRRIMQVLPDSVNQRLAEIESKLLTYRSKEAIYRKAKLATAKLSSFELTDEIAKLQTDYARILQDVAENIPSVRDMIEPLPKSASVIRGTVLSGDEVLLEFNVTKSETNVFLLTKDTLVCNTIHVGRDELRAMLADVSPVFGRQRDSNAIFNSTLANFSAEASHKLYLTLFSWCEPYLVRKNSLIIVADDCIQGLCFESLVCSQQGASNLHHYSQPDFLVRRFAVRYVDAASRHEPKLESGYKPMRLVLAMGDPKILRLRPGGESTRLGFAKRTGTDGYLRRLPGAQEEVRAIESLFKSHADALLGPHASKKAFIARAREFRIIHLASHVFIDPDDAMFSYVYMAGDLEQEDSGTLHAFEILNVEINAELVVLSSCNTARRGFEAPSAGFFTAFIAAGVPSVIAAMWEVDDESSAFLMERFYTYLGQGISKSASLQRAKVDLIRSGKSDPFYWATYMLFGEDTAVKMPGYVENRWASWMFAFSLATFVGMCLLGFWLWKGRPRTVYGMLCGSRRPEKAAKAVRA